MTRTTTPTRPDHTSAAGGGGFLLDTGFGPIEAGLRERLRPTRRADARVRRAVRPPGAPRIPAAIAMAAGRAA
jgi:hypothetical protein